LPKIGRRICVRRRRPALSDRLTADAQRSLAQPDLPLVEIAGVGKTFGAKVALDDVTWSLRPATISGLLGPNGAGKTTLFRLLMGILQPTSGSMRIGGLDCFADRVAVKRLVGFLPDEPVFYTYLSGQEVLELSAGMHGLDVSRALARLTPLVERLAMTDALPRFADDYSRGMKKKLGLLLALLHEPVLLLLDEPTNGLDVDATRLFFDLMRELAAAGTTVVFSTHLIDQVERLCSHAAIIREGRLVASGTLAELRAGPDGVARSLEDVFVERTHSGR